MMPPDAERRPVAGTAIEVIAATTHTLPRIAPVVVDGAPARVVLDADRPVDLASIGRPQLDIFAAGFTAGYCEGFEKGRQDADDEAEKLFQTATRVVHFMAGIDPYEQRQARAMGRA